MALASNRPTPSLATSDSSQSANASNSSAARFTWRARPAVAQPFVQTFPTSPARNADRAEFVEAVGARHRCQPSGRANPWRYRRNYASAAALRGRPPGRDRTLARMGARVPRGPSPNSRSRAAIELKMKGYALALLALATGAPGAGTTPHPSALRPLT